MALYKAGNGTSPAATGQVFFECGFQPAAVIFMSDSEGITTSYNRWQAGFGISSSLQRSIHCSQQNGAATSNANRIQHSDGCMVSGFGQTIDLHVVYVGPSSTGFTLDFTNVASGQEFSWLAIGGQGVTADIRTVTLTSGGTSQVVGSLGFDPDFALAMGIYATSFGVWSTNAIASVGTAGSQGEFVQSFASANGTATMNAGSSSALLSYIVKDWNQTNFSNASIAMGTNQLTLTAQSGSWDGELLHLLIIGGVDENMDTQSVPALTGNTSHGTATAFGTQGLKAALLLGGHTTTVPADDTNGAWFNFGWIVKGTGGAANFQVLRGFRVADGVADENVQHITINGSAYGTLDPVNNAYNAIADLVSFETTALTLNWAIAGTAYKFGMHMLGGDEVTTSFVKFWNGSSWILKPLKRWDGTLWKDTVLKRWDGAAWIIE